jgi:hypothetical protein
MGEIGKEEYSCWRALVSLTLAHGKPPHSLNCFHKHVVLYDVTMLLRLHSKPFYELFNKNNLIGRIMILVRVYEKGKECLISNCHVFQTQKHVIYEVGTLLN